MFNVQATDLVEGSAAKTKQTKVKQIGDWHLYMPWHLSRNVPGIFGNQQQHYMEVIKRMLVQCMQDQENPQVRSSAGACRTLTFPIYASAHLISLVILQIRTLAARAAASFVLSNESNSALLKHFSDLLPGILQVSQQSPPVYSEAIQD